MIHFLPTVVWIFLIVCPYVVCFRLFDIGSSVQTGVVVWVTICLFAVDCVVSRSWSYRVFSNPENRAVVSAVIFAKCSLFLCLVFAIAYCVLAPKIPLFHLFGESGFSSNAELRDLATKSSGIPSFFFYSFQSIYFVAVVLCLQVFWNEKLKMCFIFLFFMLVAILDGSKYRGLLLVAVFGLFCISHLCRLRASSVFGLTGPLIAVFSVYSLSWALSVLNWCCSDVVCETPIVNSHFTVADQIRLLRSQADLFTDYENIVSYLSYRFVLIPVDVSFRWYEWIAEHAVFMDFTTGLASEIGRSVYFSRFPDFFLESVSAYASFDADWYVRFGYFGVTFAIVLVCSLRIILALLMRYLGHERAYAFATLALSLLLPQASIHAILIAQGFLLMLIIYACLTIAQYFMGKDPK